MRRFGLIAGLALALAGCGSERADNAAATASPAAARPPAAFAQCMSCHSVEPGRNGVGPTLHGVVGRKAASVPGFAYSPALAASGLTWDAATLDKWLENPVALVPGTRMVYFGERDPGRRKQMIDYLAQQK